MVDLAKIRKKAKKVAAAVVEDVVEEVAGRWSPVAEGPQEGAATVSPQDQPGTGNRAPGTDGQAPATGQGASASSDQRPATAPSPATDSLSKLKRFKATAGQRRAVVRVESVEPEEGAESTQLELLTFVIAGEQYAVEIEKIVEIVTPRPVTRIPNADPSIVGIISLRGTIVTLVDVRRKLKHPDAETAGADPRIVVVEQEGETIGFEVDRVLRVIKMERTGVEPHPVVHISEQDESIRGVFRQAGALTILLDFDKLLDGRSLAGASA